MPCVSNQRSLLRKAVDAVAASPVPQTAGLARGLEFLAIHTVREYWLETGTATEKEIKICL